MTRLAMPKKPPCAACAAAKKRIEDMPNRTHEEMCNRIDFLEQQLKKKEEAYEDMNSDKKRVYEEKWQLEKKVDEMNKQREQLDEQSRQAVQDREQAQGYVTRIKDLNQQIKDLTKQHKADIEDLEAKHHKELDEQEKRLAPKRRQIEYESDEDKDACYVCGKRHIHRTNGKRERSQRRCLDREQSKGLHAGTTYTAFKLSRTYKENKAKHQPDRST